MSPKIYGDNFKPHYSTSTNISPFTNQLIRAPTSQNNIHLSPPPIQVYLHQQALDKSSHLSTPSSSNYTESSQRDQTNDSQYNHLPCYISHNAEEESEQDYLLESNMNIQIPSNTPVSFFGLCLFNSGSTSTLISKCTVPPQVKTRLCSNQMVITT